MRSTSGFPRVSPEGSAYSTGTALQSPKDPSIAIPRVAGVVVNIEARIGARTIRRTTAAIPARDRAHSRPADGRAPAGRPRRPFVNPFPFTRPFVRPSPRARPDISPFTRPRPFVSPFVAPLPFVNPFMRPFVRPRLPFVRPFTRPFVRPAEAVVPRAGTGRAGPRVWRPVRAARPNSRSATSRSAARWNAESASPLRPRRRRSSPFVCHATRSPESIARRRS